MLNTSIDITHQYQTCFKGCAEALFIKNKVNKRQLFQGCECVFVYIYLFALAKVWRAETKIRR